MSSRSRVAEMYRKGWNARRAADELHFARGWVEDVYKELSHAYEWTPERIDLLCTMWRAMVPVAHIAARMECAPSLISRKASEIGLKSRKSSSALADRKPIIQTMARSCLCCERSFYSQGAHNRLCANCRQSSNLDYATPSYGRF